MTMLQKIRANGVELGYRIDGAPQAAPWVVLSHSLACDHTMWDPQMEALRNFRVLRFDTRGHGASEAPIGPYTMDQLAADAHALLDALSIERFHFVGLSMGGMIGQQLALRLPLRTATLTLADTTSRYPAETRPVWEQRMALVRTQGMGALVPTTLERWFTASFRERHTDTAAGIAAKIRATPVAGYLGCAHAISHIDLTARLPTIDCPTLVIVGADDQGTPPSMAEEIVRAIDGSRLEIIPAAAHLSNIEQPAHFNTLLRGFLTANS
jgi:3-oxoadipate enol-lactonase